jgi:hypothetical protein
MIIAFRRNIALFAGLVLSFMQALPARAVQFSYLDPNYSQQIFAAPLTPNEEAGMAWTTNGNLLTRAGNNILEHSLTQNVTVNGTNVHGVTVTHTITGLSTSGIGMTTGFDGKIYTVTGSGLERFDPNNWAAPASLLPGSVGGPGWGVTTMSNGKIAYSDSANIYVYDPVALTNTPIYTSGAQVDDIEASPSGYIVLSGHNNNTLTVITNAGSPVLTFSTATGSGLHAPDGLAFGDSVNADAIFSNNNDGTITKYQLSPGFTSLLSSTDIATNFPQVYPVGGAYGDLASVGPDCAFYVTQYNNGGSNGSTLGVGTHWDDGSTTADASIVRISLVDSNGLEVCGFDSTTETVPEPGTLVLGGLGAMGIWIATQRHKQELLIANDQEKLSRTFHRTQ